ncbi:Aspercryptin biosynthesis cluster-specific transcription regulator atnN [Vanrija pseudolonga]|uniref:Aspercryptin biosynthesis cluster-specific transcription regulator atnN n=2 Tax=cellular organisms TaxID=131567 RepID=A0AAF0YGI1_9TREE|nr:Aspercryptin biosynthesis cluster-specific transcription regulator atnN [Vanrija pseudolonga]
MGRESSAAASSSSSSTAPTQPAAPPPAANNNSSTLQAQALLDLARLRPDELAAAVAAASASSGSNLSPDLVRLSDIVTHATMVLSQPSAQASSSSSSSGAGGGPSGPKKYTRSRRGCLTCRSRKVKCDEVRPRCLRCAGMGREVSGSGCQWDKDDKAGNKGSEPRQASQGGRAARRKQSDKPADSVSPPLKASASTSTSGSTGTTNGNPLARTDSGASTTSPTGPSTGGASEAAVADGLSQALAEDPALTAALAELVALAPTLREHLPAAGAASAPFASGTLAADFAAWPGAALTLPIQPSPAHSPRRASADDERAVRGGGGGGAASPRWDDFLAATSPFPWVPGQNEGGDKAVAPARDADAMDVEDVVELARTTDTDRRGNIQLSEVAAAQSMSAMPLPTAAAGDANLSLTLGQIAARRRTNPTGSGTPAAHSGGRPSNPATFELVAGPHAPLDPFMHAFPTASARNLFKHYVDSTSSIVTAMGRIKPGQNPFLAVSLPLVLSDTSSPACAALRFSLLTTSAVHILHLRGGQARDVAELCDRLKRLAIGYTVMSQASENAEDADLVLAACCILTTRDVLNADTTWRNNFDFAISCVRRRGGPEQLLARDPTSFTKRFVLEQLATHEVFSCFTTGSEPTLLIPNSAWWFDIERSSRTGWEWESVENQFGISRGMVEVVARICALCARKNRLGPGASLDDPDLAPVASYLRTEAEAIISELDLFGVALRSLPFHQRVQLGDHIYRMAMSLHLMTDVLGLPAEHPRVRALVPAALELCSEISMQPVMLVWPLMFISRASTKDEREWMQSLLKTYAGEYCRDLQTADELIHELWRRQDAGEAPASWHELMQDTGKSVLLI